MRLLCQCVARAVRAARPRRLLDMRAAALPRLEPAMRYPTAVPPPASTASGERGSPHRANGTARLAATSRLQPTTGVATALGGAGTPPSPGGLAWRRDFPGDPGQVREVRQWIASRLPDCPERDDVLLVASEIASN